MATNALTVDAGRTVDSDAVRDIYISAVNAAVAADRDDLAMEIAAEYETECRAVARRPEGAQV
jgi:hypothetical protein